jgi:hypothetical protein
MNAVRGDRWVEAEELAVVLMSLDLRTRRGNHAASFLAIVGKEETEEELDRRLGSCHVDDDVGQDDVEAVES